jgi:hypothetical protein
MKITILSKLKPFSHTPGLFCLIPGTFWAIRAYPTKLIFINLEQLSDIYQVDLNIQGLVKNFTCIQDLEKGKVDIFGIEKRGYFRFEILATSAGLELKLNRCFKDGLVILFNNLTSKQLYCKDTFMLGVNLTHLGCFSKDVERVSLGNHKKQDWDLIIRRSDIKEIFPIWLKLGILLPDKEPPENHPLISELEKNIEIKDKLSIEKLFLKLFFSNFKGIMCPMRTPQNHLGIIPEQTYHFSPFILLQKGATLIRRLFFHQDNDFLHILPCLPASLHCGRYINLQCDEIGTFDMEWSKKQIKKIKFRAKADKKICFKLQPKIRSFRVRSSLTSKGCDYQRDDEISLCAGRVYFFDRFRK